MDVAAAGGLILFFSILVGLVLVSLLVFSYAAYSFLVTLSNTAAGNDEVLWPGEPIQDWVFKVWYLGWLLALWAVPASFVLGVLSLPRPLFALGLAALLWLVFPVSLLSSLSAPSRLVVLRPVIVRLLLKHLGTTLRFYASSGMVVLVCGALGYAAVFGLRFLHPPIHKSAAELRLRLATALDQPVILVPLAAVVGAAGCLIYARLLGRTAFLISQVRPGRRKQAEQEWSKEADPIETFDPWSLPEEEPEAKVKPRQRRRAPSKDPPKKKKPQVRKPDRAPDPWVPPAEEPVRKTKKPAPSPAFLPEDPYGPAEGTYELMAEEASPPPAVSPQPHAGLPEDDVEPYAVSASPESEPGKVPAPVVPEVSKLEEELAAPRRLPPLPDRPLVTGVYSFPFYPMTLGPCGTLALGFLGVIALLRLLFYLFPF